MNAEDAKQTLRCIDEIEMILCTVCNTSGSWSLQDGDLEAIQNRLDKIKNLVTTQKINWSENEETIKTSDSNMDSPEIIQRCIPTEGTVEELERCSDRAEQYYMSGKLSDKKYGELCRRYYMDI
jgi:predicted metalloprotease